MSEAPILYITGTNTGVGKTTLAVQLLKAARARNLKIGALKPFCSGGRQDAEQLHALQTAGLTLDQVNPFHFRDPLTPLQAARNEGQKIYLLDALKTIRDALAHGHPLIIEGAGGLLSPLGQGFSLLDLIQNIPGKGAIVAQNTLGSLNALLLTSQRLPIPPSHQAIVYMSQPQPDPSAQTNASLLASLLPGVKIVEIPFQPAPADAAPILDWWNPSNSSAR
jgi:dethiobiotin synthetase